LYNLYIFYLLLECKNLKVSVYGSMKTKLAIDQSDLDILISGIFDDSSDFSHDKVLKSMSLLD